MDSCIDHCLLLDLDLEPNPKIENIVPPTKMPRINNKDDFDDIQFKISKKKPGNQTKEKGPDITTDASVTRPTLEVVSKSTTKMSGNLSEMVPEEESEESWVAGSGEAAFFLLDMHPDLGDPIEQLGIEIEDDSDDNVTDFIQRFGEKLLIEKGVNVTELHEADLRCGGKQKKKNFS